MHISDWSLWLLVGDDDSHNEDTSNRQSQTILVPQPSKWERDDSDTDSHQQSPHHNDLSADPSATVSKCVILYYIMSYIVLLLWVETL